MPMIVLTTRNIKFSTTSLQVKKLSDIEKESLEGLLKEKECKIVLDQLAIKKSPGVDVLTSEFYV